MMTYRQNYDAIVVGAGHAGVEAALALARLGHDTLLLTLSMDSISFMACNPNIGGTAKGHLVREIDALGGQMGINADENLLQLRMLNMGKGPAVHSLRGQTDKTTYHLSMKKTLETTPHLDMIQAEVKEISVINGKVQGVTTTTGQCFNCRAVVVASGVYLNARIIIGDWSQQVGPNGFARATYLTDNLIDLGLPTRRFKTGTPARVDKKSIDFSVMEIQNGDEKIYPFSFMHDGYGVNKQPCYLTYTTQKTKDIIFANIHRSPLYNGSIKGVGPRYCPSIEDKIMRFKDKDRHQIFVEPESAFTNEMYIQGMSSSLPFDVQLDMYHSVIGLENCKIMRYAYAIEYDCIDSLCLNAALMVKHIGGLFCAGQINGSSGYEEAAAQGIVAGINASRYIDEKEPVIFTRDNSYIGVLIDDLVTKGTNEPYRMMTARAEHRLYLRQENADQRLTPIGRQIGLVDDERWARYVKKIDKMKQLDSLLDKSLTPSQYSEVFDRAEETVPCKAMSYREMLRRNNISAQTLIDGFDDFCQDDLRELEELSTQTKYEGYLSKQAHAIEENKKLENKQLPADLDYSTINGLRLEARQKLNQIKPVNLAQASRISGVSPADITVLLAYLHKK
ncbi:MAG: tRNA uridine-5-carboxymethylaminomethyl(34) synthesis enzyme MnmG [Christensenellales bacterium]